MHELNFLEFAGITFIGTIIMLIIFFGVEIGKEVLSKELDNKPNKEDDDRS